MNGTKKLRLVFANDAMDIFKELDSLNSPMLLDRFAQVIVEVADHHTDDPNLQKIANDVTADLQARPQGPPASSLNQHSTDPATRNRFSIVP